MKKLSMPPFLHDVFGEKQSAGAILGIVLFGGFMTGAMFARFPEITEGIPLWRSILAFILIFDIASGAIANLTASTSNYYSANPNKRLIFIAVHVHIVLIAWLLGTNIWHSLLVWAFTIAGAFAVNAMRGGLQLIGGGTLFAAGIGWLTMLPGLTPYMLAVCLLFMLKVIVSFAVDHYGRGGNASNSGAGR